MLRSRTNQFWQGALPSRVKVNINTSFTDYRLDWLAEWLREKFIFVFDKTANYLVRDFPKDLYCFADGSLVCVCVSQYGTSFRPVLLAVFPYNPYGGIRVGWTCWNSDYYDGIRHQEQLKDEGSWKQRVDSYSQACCLSRKPVNPGEKSSVLKFSRNLSFLVA